MKREWAFGPTLAVSSACAWCRASSNSFWNEQHFLSTWQCRCRAQKDSLQPFNRLETPYLIKWKKHVDLYSKESKILCRCITNTISFQNSQTYNEKQHKWVVFGKPFLQVIMSRMLHLDIGFTETLLKKNSAANDWM